MTDHPRERLSAWLDGELAPDDAAAVERHLAQCTECAREAAIMKHLGGAMRTPTAVERRSVWDAVHRRITQPIGWLLVVTGTLIWIAFAVWEWSRAELTLEWLAGSAVVIGGVLLFVGIAYEQYRDWKDTRYKDVDL